MIRVGLQRHNKKKANLFCIVWSNKRFYYCYYDRLKNFKVLQINLTLLHECHLVEQYSTFFTKNKYYNVLDT